MPKFFMFPKSGHVRLSKLSAHRFKDDPCALPVEYWAKGHLAAPIRVGEPLVMFRYERSARQDEEVKSVKTAGIFETSPISYVIQLEDSVYQIRTANSVWKMEFLPVERSENVREDGGNVL